MTHIDIANETGLTPKQVTEIETRVMDRARRARHEFIESPHGSLCHYCDEPAKDERHLTQRDLDDQKVSSAWEDLQD